MSASSVTYVSFASPAKIGHRCGKIHQFLHDAARFYKSILYFCVMIERIRINRTVLVEWHNFAHNYLIFTYKVTKNLPLGQIFAPHNLLKTREISILVQVADTGQILSQVPDKVAEAPALHALIHQNNIIFENSSQS